MKEYLFLPDGNPVASEEILNWTWEQVRNYLFDDMLEYTEMMETQLRKTAGVEISDCSFVRNGRWIIATSTKDAARWTWDDTTGEWNPTGEVDDDWEEALEVIRQYQAEGKL